ncbi:DNA primase [Methylovirgula sp. 4M-Z18]|uniref:DNA primase n=1 Tax=Methylovirgula sp. 4M-Z18 TaxID=2293567 RepID=UPI0030D2D241
MPASQVIGRRVKLVKKGREWAGLSPFTAEKTPSFYVNDQKQFYHDFSSGKHGDIFSFVMDTEGLSFPETVERLAMEAGVALPEASPEMVQREERRKDLYDVCELACQFFEGRLQSTLGADARAYLQKRGMLQATQAEFRIGYAPDSRDALKTYLLQHGIREDQLLRAGLIIQPDDGRNTYDRFRGRVMIPIQDSKGRVVAFGGRVLSADAKPKYLNSPETELFHKGSMVFNAHRARGPAHDLGTIVVTEGYLDAIAVWQAGFKPVVASLGTAFTEDQIAALWQFAPEPVICFDGDRAGLSAANRAVDRILPVLKTGYSFHFAYLPGGQDPDDLIRQSGLDAFRAVLADAKPLWDVFWARETENAALKTPEQRAVLDKTLRDAAQTIVDPLVQKYYRDQIYQSLRNLFWRLDRPGRGAGAPAMGRAGIQIPPAAAGSLSLYERDFLGLAVEYPDLFSQVMDRIGRLHLHGALDDSTHDEFLHELIRLHHEIEPLDAARLHEEIDPRFSPLLDNVHGCASEGTILGHRLFQRMPILRTRPPEDFIARYFAHLMDRFLVRELETEVASMEQIGDLHDARIVELIDLREHVRHEESALAEEAENYKSLPASTTFSA